MKPPKFDYAVPTSVEEVIDVLGEHGSDAQLLAGGQSLMPALNFRLARPAVIVDLNRVSELSYIRERNGGLAIGAMTRQRAIGSSELVASRVPLLWEATRLIGHLPTRTRGTIGGSLANADPAAEYPAVAAALDGVMVLNGRRGERRVPAGDFFQGLLTTAVEPDELLVGVELSATKSNSGWSFQEISRRHGDFALAGVAAHIRIEDGNVAEARLAACGVGPGPVRLTRAEEVIVEEGISDKAIKHAAAEAAAQVSPSGDVHASADYRRTLTRVMTGRALDQASRRAAGGVE